MQDFPLKTGIIYCRVSSKEQVEGMSLESQEKICKDYALRQNINILKVFVDAGESAKTIHRPEFNKALLFCGSKKNLVNYFIVYKISRFSRNQEDHVLVKIMLKKYGVELKSATEPIDQSPLGKAIEGWLSVGAQWDNDIRSERTKVNMKECVEQGILDVAMPYWFLSTRKTKKSKYSSRPRKCSLYSYNF